MQGLAPCISLVVLVLGLFYATEACNENVCAPLVSKCQLIDACECNMVDMSNCTCCKGCHQCLEDLYTECCSCVGMCPELTQASMMTKTSSIEDLADPVPELFRILTAEEDVHMRWTIHTYPAYQELPGFVYKPEGFDGVEFTIDVDSNNKDVHKMRHQQGYIPSDNRNCTVAFMSQCMPLSKCKYSCKSMGAARFRWFHEQGCCECISSECLDYGKSTPMCLNCQSKNEVDDDDELVDGVQEDNRKHRNKNDDKPVFKEKL
ncbi:twisted gastrulation protein homolog 1-A [Lingula anatina]|uniref:Twisted gastrulation protein homolog 1-A n=1 Tax=Lingula anatina TaxID=7574 RepID=A0A1S3HAJ9_LINAN|nr:twisted gastrulation protein homolog 1-A [Lingula anatina]|eukprot:XP_013382169.1 twisted gastrulation protein homolog 1-A [Lingula anatina]